MTQRDARTEPFSQQSFTRRTLFQVLAAGIAPFVLPVGGAFATQPQAPAASTPIGPLA